jgi:hypothetical protein
MNQKLSSSSKYSSKRQLKIVGALGFVFLIVVTVVMAMMINRQKDLTAQKSQAAEMIPCDVQFTIRRPTPTPTASPSPTTTVTPTITTTPTPTPTPSYTTRTQGYWSTHTTETSAIFADQLNGIMQIGYPPFGDPPYSHKGYITNIQQSGQSQLFGAFYSSIPNKSDATTRTAIDQARMQLLQQLVTAKLNCASFGCPSSTQSLIGTSDWDYTYGTASDMIADSNKLDIYNNSGEKADATPGTSREYANIVFWDAP